MRTSRLMLFGILALASLTNTLNAFADVEGAPFIPEIDSRFDAIEQGNHLKQNSYPQGSADGHWVQQEAQATYDFAALGGASTLNSDLGVSIPKNAVIQSSGFYTITRPVSANAGTMAFYCNTQTPNDLLAPQAASTFFPANFSTVAGNQDGTMAKWSTIAAKCNIHVKLGTAALTAGKVTVFIDYVVHK